MSLSTTLFIILICLGLCGCAPLQYFENGGRSNVANKEVRRISKSRSTTVNIPTRGLYYPDDMFVTNWAPTKFDAEDCLVDQPDSVTDDAVPGCDQENENDKPSTNEKTPRQTPGTTVERYSSVAQSSSQCSTPEGQQDPSLEDQQDPSLEDQQDRSLEGQQDSSRAVQGSTRAVQGSTRAVPGSSLASKKCSTPAGKKGSSPAGKKGSTTAGKKGSSPAAKKSSTRAGKKSSTPAAKKGLSRGLPSPSRDSQRSSTHSRPTSIRRKQSTVEQRKRSRAHRVSTVSSNRFQSFN